MTDIQSAPNEPEQTPYLLGVALYDVMGDLAASFTLLYCVASPPAGVADTEYADTQVGWATLPEALRARLLDGEGKGYRMATHSLNTVQAWVENGHPVSWTGVPVGPHILLAARGSGRAPGAGRACGGAFWPHLSPAAAVVSARGSSKGAPSP